MKLKSQFFLVVGKEKLRIIMYQSWKRLFTSHAFYLAWLFYISQWLIDKSECESMMIPCQMHKHMLFTLCFYSEKKEFRVYCFQNMLCT